MESIMAIVKGKAEARRGIGNYQKHITELYRPDKQETSMYFSNVQSIVCYTKENNLITLSASFNDNTGLVMNNVISLHICPDQPKEGPDSAKL